MKKLILLPLFLICTLPLFSQQQERFYAIDGSEWISEQARNDRENTLWEETHLNIQYLQISNKETVSGIDIQALANSLQQLLVVVEEAIRYSREQNQNLSELLTPEVRAYLQEKNIQLTESQAINKETFIMKELCELYNIYLEGFSFLHKALNTMADPTSNTIDLSPFASGWLNTFIEEINSRTQSFRDKAYIIRETTT